MAVALVLIVPIALLVMWFQRSDRDDAWDSCRAAIEQELAPAEVVFSPGDHTYTDDGVFALATGTLTADGRVYSYRCAVEQGGSPDVRLEER